MHKSPFEYGGIHCYHEDASASASLDAGKRGHMPSRLSGTGGCRLGSAFPPFLRRYSLVLISPGITKDCHSFSPQLIPPFLRTMAVPRFPKTKKLERFQRQFYQWWHIDCMTQRELCRNFNVLFKFLSEYECEEYEVRKASSYLGIVLIIANNSPIQL
jgi:hypothetical protein